MDGHLDALQGRGGDVRTAHAQARLPLAQASQAQAHSVGGEHRLSCHLQAEDVIAQDPKGEPEGQLQCYHRPIVGKGDKLSGGLSTHRTFVCLFVCSFIVYNDVLKCFFS